MQANRVNKNLRNQSISLKNKWQKSKKQHKNSSKEKSVVYQTLFSVAIRIEEKRKYMTV